MTQSHVENVIQTPDLDQEKKIEAVCHISRSSDFAKTVLQGTVTGKRRGR